MKALDRLFIKAQVGFGMAKTEFQKLREEDEGLQIIITIILVALGLVLVGVLVGYASTIMKVADSQVSGIGSKVTGLGG